MTTAVLLVCGSLAPGQLQAVGSGTANDALFSPEGYRIARYRAALPERSPAGRRIGTQALAALIDRHDPLLVDVQAVTVRPETEAFGVSWLPTKTRYNLPGSSWLPNVGYGRLEPRMLAYLQFHLNRLTGSDKAKPIVFYCVVDCWMSWNAVKRAAALGYRNLFWYPEGTDGWAEAGLPLKAAEPLPLMPTIRSAECETGHDSGGFFGCDRNIQLPAALARIGAEPRLTAVMLFFETADCPFCQRMRRGLLRDPDVIGYFHQRFTAMAIDLESEAEMIDQRGVLTTQASFARETMRVHRTPTLVFLAADGEELFRHAGVIVDPRVFLGLADYVSEGHVERMGFREFLAGASANGGASDPGAD
jgi:PQQ-dependent catabolism-associated CXXCW motif protein